MSTHKHIPLSGELLEASKLLEEAHYRLSSQSGHVQAGAVWRLIDAAGLAQRAMHAAWGDESPSCATGRFVIGCATPKNP